MLDMDSGLLLYVYFWEGGIAKVFLRRVGLGLLRIVFSSQNGERDQSSRSKAKGVHFTNFEKASFVLSVLFRNC